MILSIDTTQPDLAIIALRQGTKIVAEKKFKANHREAEKLLPAIERLLKDNHLKLGDIKKVAVANRGGSFTSLRVGVVTANALAYALGVKAESSTNPGKKVKKNKNGFSLIEPFYDRAPKITIKRNKD